MYTYCKLFSPFLFPTLPVKEFKKGVKNVKKNVNKKCQQKVSTKNSQPFHDSSAI